MKLSRNTVRVRQRAAVACCIALALGSGLGLGLIVQGASNAFAAHPGKLERRLLVEIERIHARACDEARGIPVARRANTAEPELISRIHDIGEQVDADLEVLEAEAIRFGHSLDRVSSGTSSVSQRADLVTELDTRRDALEDAVQTVMAHDRAALRAERDDARDALRRLRIVLAAVSVLGMIAGILLAILAWTLPPPLQRPPIDVISTEPHGVSEKQPELLR